jgi:hypothetical protein
MLDPDVQPDAKLDVPAISVQLSTTIGANRSLALTTGLPMDCTSGELNLLLDKLAAASDRQKKRHDLENTKLLLKNEEQNLHNHRNQFRVQNTTFAAEWIEGKHARHGEYQPRGSQKSVLDGLQKNIENSTERIKQLRDAIAEMEKECR